MKRLCTVLAICLLMMGICACGNGVEESSVSSTSKPPVPETETSLKEQSEPTSSVTESSSTTENQESVTENPEMTEDTARQISVQCGDNVVVYELNDSAAATSLYEQLPLTIEVEDFSTNEKIFYPPQELNTSNSPLAQGGAGTLAYYAPWGDVVMFYGDYNENPSLFELGHVVSGAEIIGEMSGTIVIDLEE